MIIEIKKSVLTGVLADCKDYHNDSNYEIEGMRINDILYKFKNKKVKITIEEIEEEKR